MSHRPIAAPQEPAVDADGEPPRLYTNLFEIRCSISEVDMQFGQAFHGSKAPCMHSYLVTTPVHLVLLGRAVSGAISRYESEFGPIPSADTRGPD